MKLNCKNTLSGLVPIYDTDLSEKKKLKLGEIYSVEVKLERNAKLHGKYFVLLHIVYENLNESLLKQFPDFEMFRKSLQINCGYYNDVFNPVTGEYHRESKSIAWNKMDNAEFSNLYSKAVAISISHYLQGVSEDELKEEVNNNNMNIIDYIASSF